MKLPLTIITKKLKNGGRNLSPKTTLAEVEHTKLLTPKTTPLEKKVDKINERHIERPQLYSEISA